MKGNKLVEQVDAQGNIVFGYDTSISVAELYKRIKKHFPGIYKDSYGVICGIYKGKKYAIRAKNITYLGNPHPEYKKRIQISTDLQEFYKRSIERDMIPILLGVYTFEDNELFCEFCIEDFIEKKAHNSSAHVYTSDLADATIDGIFQKIDYFGNRITVFRTDAVNVFLEDLFYGENIAGLGINKATNVVSEEKVSFTITVDKSSETERIGRVVDYYNKSDFSEIESAFKDFFENEDKEWHGIDCYKKMVADNYRNKYQPEWAGFFLEYEFESYIYRNALTRLITYSQDKTEGGIDLDLYFPTIGCYGDLKAHSNNSKGIQGNDWDTVFSILDDPNNHIYYIVCEHSTVKDSDCGYEVTQYWNSIQNKDNLMSYSTRMKNSVSLKRCYILDINSSNKMYLSVFKQGINSNGKLRAPKIMIDHDKIDKFLIMEMIL